MGGLSLIFEGDALELYESRVPMEESPLSRRSFHRSLSSLSSVLSCVSSRKSFSYDKLAQVPIRLTIVKLDCSSFEIDVMMTARVADLKQAIENLFSHLPSEGPGLISWHHVWGHFCLSYGGMKLLNDGDNLKDYGIKDGDKLHFTRHTTITYNPIKKETRKQIDASKPCKITEEDRLQAEEDYGDSENPSFEQIKHEFENNSSHRRSILHRLFRGWFVCSQVSSIKQLTYERNARETRWTCGFVGCFKSSLQISDDRSPSYSSRPLRVEI